MKNLLWCAVMMVVPFSVFGEELLPVSNIFSDNKDGVQIRITTSKDGEGAITVFSRSDLGIRVTSNRRNIYRINQATPNIVIENENAWFTMCSLKNWGGFILVQIGKDPSRKSYIFRLYDDGRVGYMSAVEFREFMFSENGFRIVLETRTRPQTWSPSSAKPTASDNMSWGRIKTAYTDYVASFFVE